MAVVDSAGTTDRGRRCPGCSGAGSVKQGAIWRQWISSSAPSMHRGSRPSASSSTGDLCPRSRWSTGG